MVRILTGVALCAFSATANAQEPVPPTVPAPPASVALEPDSALEALLAERSTSWATVSVSGREKAATLVDAVGVVMFGEAGAIPEGLGKRLMPDDALIVPRRGNVFPGYGTNVEVRFASGVSVPAAVVFVSEEGLMFCQLLSKPAGQAVTTFTRDRGVSAGAVSVGETIFAVRALSEEFGNAPVLAPVRVLGEVSRPGPAWIVEGVQVPYGQPVFAGASTDVTAATAATGVLVRLKSGSEAFDAAILPERVRSLIDRARRRGEVLLHVRAARDSAAAGTRMHRVLHRGDFVDVQVSAELRASWRRLARGDVEDVSEARVTLAAIEAAPDADPVVAHDAVEHAEPTPSDETESQPADGQAPGVESAPDAALRWLARHQAQDGRWSAGAFDAQCGRGKKKCSGVDYRAWTGRGAGAGDSRLDVGVTGLALAAMVGGGNTHQHAKRSEVQRAIRRGLRFLRRKQRANGQIGNPNEFRVLNHVLATMALCELYAISGDFTLKAPSQAAVNWLVEQQEPGSGWGEAGSEPDTLTTAWAVLALKSAKSARRNGKHLIQVPDASFDGAQAWFDQVTVTEEGGPDPVGSVGFRAAGDGGATIGRSALAAAINAEPRLPRGFAAHRGTTAAATLARVLCGEKRDSVNVVRGVELLGDDLPAWGGPPSAPVGIDTLHLYFGTNAVFQATKIGSPAWQTWNRAMQEAALGNGRNRQGFGRVICEDGSWGPIGPWGPLFGRVGVTALNAMTLQIYYRYERVAGRKADK